MKFLPKLIPSSACVFSELFVDSALLLSRIPSPLTHLTGDKLESEPFYGDILFTIVPLLPEKKISTQEPFTCFPH